VVIGSTNAPVENSQWRTAPTPVPSMRRQTLQVIDRQPHDPERRVDERCVTAIRDGGERQAVRHVDAARHLPGRIGPDSDYAVERIIISKHVHCQ
jgi:hypothetical protein